MKRRVDSGRWNLIFGKGGPWRVVRRVGILGAALLVVVGGVGFVSAALDLYDRMVRSADIQSLAERRQTPIDDIPGGSTEPPTMTQNLMPGPTFAGHSGDRDVGPVATSVAIRHDGKIVASGGQDRVVRLWDSMTGQKIADLTGHQDDVTSVAFQPGTSLLASGSWDQTVRLWDVTTPSSPRHLVTLKTWNAMDVMALAFSPDGQQLAAAGGWWIEIFNVRRGSHVRDLFVGANVAMEKVAYSPDGAVIVTGGMMGGAHRAWLWDAKSGKKIKDLGDHRSYIRGVAFTPDSRHAVTASFDRFIRVWGLDGRLSSDVDTGVGVNSVVVAGRSAQLAVLAEGSSVVLRDPQTFAEKGTISVCSNAEAISVATDDRVARVAVACYDGTISIVNVPPAR